MTSPPEASPANLERYSEEAGSRRRESADCEFVVEMGGTVSATQRRATQNHRIGGTAERLRLVTALWRRMYVAATTSAAVLAAAAIDPAAASYQKVGSLNELRQAVLLAGDRPSVCTFVAPWCSHSNFTSEHMALADKVLEQLRGELVHSNNDRTSFADAQFLEVDAIAVPSIRDLFVGDRFPVVNLLAASNGDIKPVASYNGERVVASIVNWVLQQASPVVKAATSWDLVDKLGQFGSSIFILELPAKAPSKVVLHLQRAFERFASSNRAAGIFVSLEQKSADARTEAIVHAVHPGYGSTSSMEIPSLTTEGMRQGQIESVIAERVHLMNRHLETHSLPYISGVAADNFERYGFGQRDLITRSLPGSIENENITALVWFVGTDMHFQQHRRTLELSAQQLWNIAKVVWLHSERYDGHVIGALGIDQLESPSLLVEVLLERVTSAKPNSDTAPRVPPAFATFTISDPSRPGASPSDGSLASILLEPDIFTRSIQSLLRDVANHNATPYRRGAMTRKDLFETTANLLEGELTGQDFASSSSCLAAKPDYLLLVFLGNSNPVLVNLEMELRKLAAILVDEEVQDDRNSTVGVLTIDVRVNDVAFALRRFAINSFPAAVAVQVGKTPQKFRRFSGAWTATSLRAFLIHSVEELNGTR